MRSEKYFTFVLILLDILAVVFAFTFSYFLRNKGFFRVFLDSVQPIEVYLKALPFAILLLIIIYYILGLYEPKKRLSAFLETYNIIKATTFWSLLIMAGSYLSKFDYSRIIVMLFYLFSLLFITTGRLLIRYFHTRSNYFGKTNIAIIGTGRPAREITRRLEIYRFAGINLVGFVTNGVNSIEKNILGELSGLYKIIKKYQIHEVYFADPSLSYEKILTIIAKCPSNFTEFKVTSNIFKHITGNVDLANLEHIPSLDLTKANFPLWKSFTKRSIDLLLSLFGMFITFPLWIAIIAVIKIESKGPAIFAQKRIGEDGKVFFMYKFRTLLKIEKYKKAQVKKDDQRVTGVGKFLRTTSLDELPQLINIIKGEMSIVGPRPEMPHIVKNYNQWEKRRLLIKPGLTGLWQVLGRKDLPLSENLEYDFYYISNHSFLLDITIMLKTIPIVLLRKGAY